MEVTVQRFANPTLTGSLTGLFWDLTWATALAGAAYLKLRPGLLRTSAIGAGLTLALFTSVSVTNVQTALVLNNDGVTIKRLLYGDVLVPKADIVEVQEVERRSSSKLVMVTSSGKTYRLGATGLRMTQVGQALGQHLGLVNRPNGHLDRWVKP